MRYKILKDNSIKKGKEILSGCWPELNNKKYHCYYCLDTQTNTEKEIGIPINSHLSIETLS